MKKNILLVVLVLMMVLTTSCNKEQPIKEEAKVVEKNDEADNTSPKGSQQEDQEDDQEGEDPKKDGEDSKGNATEQDPNTISLSDEEAGKLIKGFVEENFQGEVEFQKEESFIEEGRYENINVYLHLGEEDKKVAEDKIEEYSNLMDEKLVEKINYKKLTLIWTSKNHRAEDKKQIEYIYYN